MSEACMDQFAFTNDQSFLLNFIMGTYFGPDVKTDIPRLSATQRRVEGLPPYDITDLCSTLLKRSDIESLYFYVLRNAHPSAVVKWRSLDLYFDGNLSPHISDNLEDKCRFTSLFPLNIHDQGTYEGDFKMFNGIIIIDDPDTTHIKSEDLQRFKQLTGVSELKINRGEAQLYHHVYRSYKEQNIQIPNSRRFGTGALMEGVTDGNAAASQQRSRSVEGVTNEKAATSQQRSNPRKRRRSRDTPQMQNPPHVSVPSQDHVQSSAGQIPPMQTTSWAEPVMLVLGSTPKIELLNKKTTSILTGTAKDGRAGPPVGLVDIGINKYAYLFRVALPGVMKDDRKLFLFLLWSFLFAIMYTCNNYIAICSSHQYLAEFLLDHIVGIKYVF